MSLVFATNRLLTRATGRLAKLDAPVARTGSGGGGELSLWLLPQHVASKQASLAASRLLLLLLLLQALNRRVGQLLSCVWTQILSFYFPFEEAESNFHGRVLVETCCSSYFYSYICKPPQSLSKFCLLRYFLSRFRDLKKVRVHFWWDNHHGKADASAT